MHVQNLSAKVRVEGVRRRDWRRQGPRQSFDAIEGLHRKPNCMKHALEFKIQPQPNDSSCGPTCLAAVYQYWNDPVELADLIREIGQLRGGGTLAVDLACHALRRGYDARITTYNLHLFDPTWFNPGDGSSDSGVLAEKLQQQLRQKGQRIGYERLQAATESYLEYLALGGRVQMRPLDPPIFVESLVEGVPILCGLSATYLYRECRERSQAANAVGQTSVADDIGGDPAGHFVVLHGYDRASGEVLIADPLHPNPIAPTNNYPAPLGHLASAILLGIVTYDANLMTLVPRPSPKEGT